MSNFCYVCGKGPAAGNRVSNANNRTKRRFMPNLQRVHVRIGGASKQVKVCTRCLKAGKVAKA